VAATTIRRIHRFSCLAYYEVGGDLWEKDPLNPDHLTTQPKRIYLNKTGAAPQESTLKFTKGARAVEVAFCVEAVVE
jgi:hypothetical protein